MTQQDLRRRSSWLAATILIAVALLAPEFPGARIALSSGSVEIGRGEPPVWTQADSGAALGAGDRVRTGSDGKAEVTVAGATVRLYPNSMLRLPASAPQRDGDAVELREGTSLFDVLRRSSDAFEVRTPEVVVSVKGTRFAVSVGEHAASVSVFRGIVGVRGDGQAHEAEMLVHPGFLAHGSDHFELSWLGIDDPWDGWSQDAFDAESLQGAPVEAALQDARFAALDLAKELHVPASQAPEAGSDGGPDLDEKSDGTPERDPVADAGDDTKRGIVEQVIENILNGPDDPSGGSPGGPTGPVLDVVFVDGSGVSGPDVVQVLDGTTTWVFERDDLEDVVDDDESLPADLLAILDRQGVEDELFANQLLSMFGGGGGDDDDDD